MAKALSPAAVQILRAHLHAKRARERRQLPLIQENDLHHETIRAKLDGLWETTQFVNFSRCGHESIYRTCKCCGQVTQMPYRCSIKWCPRCSWRITDGRKKMLHLWASRIDQPKHLVLTQRNFSVLTGRKIREHTRNLARLRRSKCFQRVRGGSISVEITNEGNGWHLHSHWLLDCRWLDMPSVTRRWAKLVG